jgi:D-aminopeptidase
MGVTIYCFHAAVAVAYVATGVIRARDLGIPFDGVSGELNAITDVREVEVGHVTLIEGDGKLIVGQGPVRTGVTAILPLGRPCRRRCSRSTVTEK